MNVKKSYLALLLVLSMFIGAGLTFAGTQFLDLSAQTNEIQISDPQDQGDKKEGTAEETGDLSKVNQAYKLIQEQYVEGAEHTQLVEGAIQGMLETLDDPYSVYMDKETMDQFNQSIESTFEGIGTEVSMVDGKVTIVSPFKGSPAEKAGLKPNDQIVSVDGESIEGLDLYEAVLKIRGEKGSTVTLEVNRPNVSENLSIEVKRDTIPIETVYSSTEEIDGKKVGVLEITSFASETAADFNEKLAALEDEGIEGLVIDVRGNPGGLFTAAEDILKNFITKDQPYVQLENSAGEKERIYSSRTDKKDYPINVLINEGSASASEILAGAMQEAGGYDLVGETTFGKGTVQQAVPLGDGSNIKLTIMKWLTPNGNWIHEDGIKPTIEAKLPSYFYSNPIQLDEGELQYNDNSEKVANVQEMLAGLGYDPGRKDGYYSQETEKAVKNFQRDAGIEVTGKVNEETANGIESQVTEQVRSEENDTQLDRALQSLFKS
ncbi:peptidase S41 [Pontibacillus halophilus JSM 076056 = DSM 19796]|uniref:C-terminal processing peptidase n=1 Tax=Pontibacillus halophilus JSM 076056 = DSM 19796 TaxID=1385510 RepID=A0A0A5GP35_9BACI|nr:S41 family peptidase [Pontibacillus halophilus]KGX92935.1 peptidase S41 [Pontibacillus halophilus JSM 076056 = DSM 19796]